MCIPNILNLTALALAKKWFGTNVEHYDQTWYSRLLSLTFSSRYPWNWQWKLPNSKWDKFITQNQHENEESFCPFYNPFSVNYGISAPKPQPSGKLLFGDNLHMKKVNGTQTVFSYDRL